MKHRIETTFDNLDDLITETGYEAGGHEISYAFDRVAVVIVKGNGAVLRDVVTDLDRRGLLG